ncbi:MAG TPA: DMT family transporter [Chloroflexi bacterium]|nr:DMT family transporter [Chloroflexota bacterium]
MPRWQADLILGVITLIWGATFVMVKNALGSVGPLTFVAWRFVAASLVLLAIFRRRMRTITRAEALAGAVIGVWLWLGYTLQTVGLQFTTTGETAFITGLNVVLVPLLAALLLRRTPTTAAVVGSLVATVGLGLLVLDESLRLQSGDLWVLGGMLGFTLHIVSISHFAIRFDTARLAVMQVGTVAGLALLAAFALETPTLALPAPTWGAIGFTGVVATALVFSLQTHAQRFTTPAHTALIFSLEPVFGAFFGWWWAGELLGVKELAGCGLILTGILLSEVASGRRQEETVTAS